MNYDITVLTDRRYVNPAKRNDYINNVLHEDDLVVKALEAKGLKVCRTNWDDPSFDWSSTKYALFRTTWDYFDRFNEFMQWLDQVKHRTRFINSYEIIKWNIDKSYLFELGKKGIPIPDSKYIHSGSKANLSEILSDVSWKTVILKPAIAGAARHTYKFDLHEADRYNEAFTQLIANENMILQEYQQMITEMGEITLMIFGGKYSHAVLKRAKPGDFRVQDDFGGTVHPYEPEREAIELAEHTFNLCPGKPAYGRVDMMWDNNGQLCISELELIEPELWFRKSAIAADLFSKAILEKMKEFNNQNQIHTL